MTAGHTGPHRRTSTEAHEVAPGPPRREDPGMLRVYLDQNKWVDLARAAIGHPLGDRFRDALDICRAAAKSGTASFPLDMYRYWETGKRRSDRSRNAVADVMLELSRHHTMALPFDVLDHEIDIALQRRYGRPVEPRRHQLFGLGMEHIARDRIDWPQPDLSRLPDGAATAGVRTQLTTALRVLVEDAILRAGPHTFQQAGFDHRTSDHAERFVEFERKVAALIAEHGLTGDDVDLVVRGADFGDIRPAVETALARIGVAYDDFVGDAGAAIVSFIDDLPTRYVTNVLRSEKHRQKQDWEPNDFIDVLALPVAAVYCDVVVTEKQWVHMMRRGRVDHRYGTRLLSDTADLVPVLVEASLA